jgi:DNA-binding NarL/FixJ family response regulator/tetratricopeptide (TPR) repeat protein
MRLEKGGTSPRPEHLVGRAYELALFERLLDELDRGNPAAVALLGEPGIGKTRLLSELGQLADQRGQLVLNGSASELERDLPFSVFVDALDPYVGSLESQGLGELDEQVRAEIAHVFPSLWALAGDHEISLQHERFRSHRAVRALLAHLAASMPLVLILDDLHWADPASVELLGALLHRPPTGAVLLAMALRPLQVPKRLPVALERAHRSRTLDLLELASLTPAEGRELLGDGVDAAAAALIYEESGGNPFYLEQLARSPERATGPAISAEPPPMDIGVPPSVAASLIEELGSLSDLARQVFEGAAVAGDPFEPELAGAAAETPEAATMDAIDELLRVDLVRTTDVPRRFRFRHPLVRRAAYQTATAAWRLGAHERCAEVLAARGAPAPTRAHHVERSAHQGDLAAAAILREAGVAAARLAPETAARWFGGALRLLPATAHVEDRVELILARANALAAAGHFATSHEALLEAIESVADRSSALSTMVATACARLERFLGRYEPAHARLVAALRGMPAPTSPESVGLLIELTLNEFYRARYEAMHEWAGPAVGAARFVGDAPLLAAALAMPALAHAITGATGTAESHRAEAAALIDGLSDDELSLRLDAAAWLAAAELYLDRYAEADAHASRALTLARATGRGDAFGLYQLLPRVWYVRGKLAEATVLLDGAIEAGRLLGTPPALAGNLFNRSAVAVAVGDLEIALATAEEAVEVTRELDEGFVTAWAAMRLASVLLETGQPVRAMELLLGRAGSDEATLIPGGWRAFRLELLTRCQLALDRPREAERAACLAEVTAADLRLPLATAWADRAVAAVALHLGDSGRAIERALASAEFAQEVGAPIEAALSRTLAGRALADAGQSNRAVAELQLAASALDACGAQRYREAAERELGKLGHRPHRRTRPGNHGLGIESLTERELQIARHVVDRRTNPEIAAELYLSPKTVETHLRNIFNKVGVATRVELARAVERADRLTRTTDS